MGRNQFSCVLGAFRPRRRLAVAVALGVLGAAGSAAPATAARFTEHRHVRAVPRASLASAADIASSPSEQYAVGGIAMTTARRIADSYWGYDPCNGLVQISWAQLAQSLNAASTWWNPTDAYANPLQNDNCQVQFNLAQAWDWKMFCTVFVHEFGHLTGHPHVSDPNAVMYPVYVAPLAQCQTPDPTAGPVAPPAPATAASRRATRAATARRAAGKHHRRVARHRRRHHRRRHAAKRRHPRH